MNYASKLKDPRWQKKRLEIMQRDFFRCRECKDSKSTLTVHHKEYENRKDPWDYPDENLITLCEKCHTNVHAGIPLGRIEWLDKIRKILQDETDRLGLPERLRFDMSGYDGGKKGSCSKQNIEILTLFSHLGIYDHVTYLFVDFYKGTPMIYWQYFGDEGVNHETDFGSLSGFTTSEIIYEVFKITLMSGRKPRRRD